MWFFEKFSKIDKSLARWTKEQRKAQITRVRKEKGDSNTDPKEIQIIIKEYLNKYTQTNRLT